MQKNIANLFIICHRSLTLSDDSSLIAATPAAVGNIDVVVNADVLASPTISLEIHKAEEIR